MNFVSRSLVHTTGRLSRKSTPILRNLLPRYNFVLGAQRPAFAVMSQAEIHSSKKQKRFHKKTKREKGVGQGSTEEVLLADVQDLLRDHEQQQDGAVASDEPAKQQPERFTEVDVEIQIISSTGDGLGFSDSKDYVYVVPFTSPGDKVRAKVITHFEDDKYALADFVKVLEPGKLRDDTNVSCPYFSKCSGCQFQMLSYKDQLAHKKTVVERAYRHFSNLTPESIPAVEDTMTILEGSSGFPEASSIGAKSRARLKTPRTLRSIIF